MTPQGMWYLQFVKVDHERRRSRKHFYRQRIFLDLQSVRDEKSPSTDPIIKSPTLDLSTRDFLTDPSHQSPVTTPPPHYLLHMSVPHCYLHDSPSSSYLFLMASVSNPHRLLTVIIDDLDYVPSQLISDAISM